ncbi:MAG: hypothetical protein ACI4E1_12940 [Lachnospira sp.]
MFKNKYFIVGLCVAGLIVSLLLLLFFVRIINSDNDSRDGIEDTTDSSGGLAIDTDKSNFYKYMIKATKDTVVIYIVRDEFNEELEFFDYASIRLEQLPVDARKNIETGIYFDNEKELYEFLQAYSS